MVVGYGADKGQIDQKAGSLAVQIRETLKDIQQFQLFLAAITNDELVEMGYNVSEVTLLKSAFSQLDEGRKVLTGLATVGPSSNDFLFFSNKLTGVN